MARNFDQSLRTHAVTASPVELAIVSVSSHHRRSLRDCVSANGKSSRPFDENIPFP